MVIVTDWSKLQIMKLIEIWKRLGKQPLKITQNKDALVFIDGKEYVISKIRYDNGEFVGFEAEIAGKNIFHNRKLPPNSAFSEHLRSVYEYLP